MLRTPAWALVSVTLLSCQPADAPFLEVTATPRSIDGRGATTDIEVAAFSRPDVPGTGSVRLSSSVGSFSTPVTVMLDAAGKGSAPFTCTTASDAKCSARVTITADWLFKEMTISSEVRVTISAAGGGSAGGSAAGGSAAGGSAAGGSAAGGSAAGGSAAGGSAAGGSAAGGSAAGGSAAGGSAAGGSAAGGSAGGSSAGGSAGGSAAGGSAGGRAGGSAAGGSAAGGSAAGGSAAGGSAAGGSAAGGSAAGGSAAGGSAAGGSAAGGSAAGGSAAGGAAGGSVPINVRAPVINPAGLVAFGTLTNGQCEGAFAALDAGQTAYVGVPCGLDPTVAFLRPDGGFVYRNPTTSRVMAAVPDPMGFNSNGWLYPTTPDNDLDVTPGCTGNPTRFVLRPNNGSVVARCSNGTWVEGSTAIPALAGLDVIAFATNGTALVTSVSGLQLISTAGNVTPMTAPFTPTTKMTRANAQGFLAVQTTPTCSLYQLTLSGTATKIGDYTTTSAIGTVPTFCNGRIDANGTLFFGTTSIGGSRIVHRPLDPGSMTWAFGTNTTATVWDFGPRFNLLLLDGNGIVTSP